MINFITPLYRYNNLETIYKSIINHTTNFTWYLIEGTNKIGEYNLTDLINNCNNKIVYTKIITKNIWGHEQRNFFIKHIPRNDNDWCYFLDDDNTITKDLIDVSKETEENIDLVLLSQKCGTTSDTRLYGMPGHLSLGNCDIGSFIIRYRTIKNTFIYFEDQRNADGHYCEQLAAIPNINIRYCLDKFTTYNALSNIIK
jgi:hypothetical protein